MDGDLGSHRTGPQQQLPTVFQSSRGISPTSVTHTIAANPENNFESDILPELQPLQQQLAAPSADTTNRSAPPTPLFPSTSDMTQVTPSPFTKSREMSDSIPPLPPHSAVKSRYVQQPALSTERSVQNGEHSPAPRRSHPAAGSVSRTSIQKLLTEKQLYIPHLAPRVTAQLNYLEHNRVSQLRDHTAAVKTIYNDLLQLQLKLSDTARFHLFFESEHSAVTTGTSRVTSVDLFSIFSPTVSTESHSRRDNICTIREVLVDFKHLCDADRTTPVHSRSSDPAQPYIAQATQHPSTPRTDSDTPAVGKTSNTQPPNPCSETPSQDPPQEKRDDDYGAKVLDEVGDFYEEWYLPPQSILDQMTLPDWFPTPKQILTPAFTDNVVTIDIDRFQHITLKHTWFVYRTLLRTAHKKSLLPSQREKYEGNKHFKRCFSFIPFGPPWFRAQFNCRIDGKSIRDEHLRFDSTIKSATIPQIRDIRK